MKLGLRYAVAAFAAIISAPSSAATIIYTLSGAATAQFSIDSAPNPDQVYGTAFRLNHVQGSFAGAAVMFDKLFFYSSADMGGVGATFSDGTKLAFSTAGEQLFTGTLAAPIMRIGTFALTRYGASGSNAEQYILTSSLASASSGGGGGGSGWTSDSNPPAPPSGGSSGPSSGQQIGPPAGEPGGGLLPPPNTGPNLPLEPGPFLPPNGVGAVPEPATWAMMILGFGAIGGALRRRGGAAPGAQLA